MKTLISRGSAIGVFALFAMAAPLAAQEAPVAEVASIGADELVARIAADEAPTILDVRTPEEFAEGHISGAINIPYTELEERSSELEIEGSDELVVYCQSGRRAAIAEATLAELGFTNVRDLEGHIGAWKEAGRPLE